MTFNDDIKMIAERANNLKDSLTTEEATKMSLVVPMFQTLGYDVFNPNEFCPEYTADVGIKKGEKIDYAIIVNGEPVILIECKCCTENLDKHGSQLFRYFGTSSAKFGILTNGITYKFYTDLDEHNKMDLTPFLEIELFDLKEPLLNELKKFTKEAFDPDSISSTASDLKYSNLIKSFFKKEMEDPSDTFIKFILSDIYEGLKNQKVLDRFRPITKKAFTAFVNDIVNQKISSALSIEDPKLVNPHQIENPEDSPTEDPVQTKNKIVTTEEEKQAFYVIRGMLSETVNMDDISYKDNEKYFAINYKDNSRKPICRLSLDGKRMQIMLPDENKKFTRYYLESLGDLQCHKEALIECVNRYAQSSKDE